MTTAHFKGQFEVELKYRIDSPSAFKHALGNISHQIRFENNAELDWYYDTPTRDLFTQNKHVLLRDIQPSNIQLWVVKGPGDDCCEATDIVDINAAKNMLVTMGYEIVLAMKKTRSIYYIGEYHVTFDYLEGLGYFAEFAIMTDDEAHLEYHRKQLVKLAKQFHLTTMHQENKSYRTLMTELTSSLPQFPKN